MLFCGDCVDPGYSQYHQSPVRLWTCSRFNPGDRALPIWSMDESNHRHLSISTQMYQARRLWVPVCWITHGILLDDTCVLNSAGMMFRLEQGLENKIGSVTREEASFLLSVGAKNPAARECKLWRELQVETLVVVGAVGKSRGPRQRFGAESLDIVQSHILMSSSRSLSWFRGQSSQILCECDSVPHCDGKRHQHRWEQLQRTCHVHSITKRHV